MNNIIDVKQQRSMGKQFRKPKAITEQEFLEASLTFFKNNALKFKQPANANIYHVQSVKHEQIYA
jgi:hypothetical protein